MCTRIATGQRLSRIGKTIHQIGEERKELHQQRIDGKHRIAHSGGCGGKKRVDDNDARGTQKYVAIDFKEGEQSIQVSTLPH